ncbi:MAG TPA: class I SAM-dependent methyltransferase [Anaerolineae bacterium]|nr:class I SAM-dependent methyltransferase [Anaerolineae bacterium]
MDTSQAQARVKAFYDANVRGEWRRLVKDAYHRLEYDTTLHSLQKYLPPAGRVLDAGGGPGRYTVELARRGFEVVLLDLTPANLDFARRVVRRASVQDKVAAITEGSIVDLSQFGDATFDATLCLGGPLSHVVDAGQRAKAVSELVRVTKPGGVLAASVMGRLALLALELSLFQHEIELPHFAQVRDTGDYAGDSGFTACHFFLPEELAAAFRAQGVTIVEMVGLEGLGSLLASKVNRLARNEARWKVWLETHYQTCTHPAVVGTSAHFLIVCRKS